MRLSTFAALIIFLPLLSFAQIDATSELLLRPASSTTPNESGLLSGRYKIRRPVKTLPGKKVGNSEVNSLELIQKATTVVVPPSTSTTTSTTTSTSAPSAKPTTTTMKIIKSQNPEIEKALFSPPPVGAGKPVEKSAESVEKNPEVELPAVTDQVREIVLGNNQPAIEAYKEQIHPDDIRLNRVEIDVAPGLVSDTSKSNNSFRNYSTFSPKISLGGRIWMNPFLGVYGQYTTSMGNDVSDDPAIQSRTMAQHEWTEIGVDMRKFFGMSRKSNSVQFGFHYSEYKFIVPGDDLYRATLRSTGLGLHLYSRIPVAPSYAWVFGGKFIPRVQHTEVETGINLSSGSGGESSRLDLTLGGEFKMSRQHQITWDITTSFEKNQFSGQSNTVDPETGVKPKGVSVENTFCIFSLGYRWGQ